LIPLIVALPLLTAFLIYLALPIGLRRIVKPLFLAGIFSPWFIFLILVGKSHLSEVVGGWSRVSGIEVAFDFYNVYFILAELILFSLVSLYSITYFKHRSVEKVYVLMLLMHAGLLGAFVSRDLFNYYIYMEIASVSSFALTGLSEEKGAKGAAFKYLIFSLLASYFFVFSIGLIYLKTGYLNLKLIGENFTPSRELNAALGIAFTSLLLKAGIFPLHFWLPDAHSKAPTPISALLSGIVVKAPLYGMLMLALTFPLDEFLKKALLLIAFSSMFFGIAMALLQMDAKKLLAYHTVSQLGYILLGIATLNFYGAIYHAFAHALFKGGLFLSVGTLINAQKTKNLKELTYRHDKILMMSILMLSLAIGGISPFIGAFSKKQLLNGLVGCELFYLAGIGTLVSFAKLNYYLLTPGKAERGDSLQRAVSITLAFITLGFGIYFLPELSLKNDSLNILAALILFYVLKKMGLFRIKMKAKFGKLGREINFYSAVFALLLLLFLLKLF